MRRATICTLAAALGCAAPAHASKTQESIFMDDPKIVYSAPDRLEGTLAEIQSLGADRIRVSVFWSLVAPAPRETERPFGEGGGADPRNYSAEKWDRYDAIVTTAQRLGLKLLFNLTGPAPYWATGTPPDPPPRRDIKGTFRPSAEEFKDFVTAVATRYSGSFADEAAQQRSGASLFQDDCLPTPNIPLPPAVCPPEGEDPGPTNPNPPNTGPVLPRVDSWSFWNEPNIPGWLTPQWHENDSALPAAPHIYRALADAGYSALQETGHGSDMMLIAETAPRGTRGRSVTSGFTPLRFVRELYCLDKNFRHYTGTAASRRDCPEGGGGFAAAHPVLFNARGFAHHPYSFLTAPGVSDRARDHAVLADLDRLTQTLDTVFKRHGSTRRIPIWITEYGYQTDPPDPYTGWSWKRHASYLAHAEWLGYRRHRVKSSAQFLLYDDRPIVEFPPSDPRHWGTFQTGLRTYEGKRKKAYRGYQRTIHVQRYGRRRKTMVFGLYRPATSRRPARVRYKRKGSKRWLTVRKARTNRAGFMRVRLKRRPPGAYRIVFRTGNGRVQTRKVIR